MIAPNFSPCKYICSIISPAVFNSLFQEIDKRNSSDPKTKPFEVVRVCAAAQTCSVAALSLVSLPAGAKSFEPRFRLEAFCRIVVLQFLSTHDAISHPNFHRLSGLGVESQGWIRGPKIIDIMLQRSKQSKSHSLAAFALRQLLAAACVSCGYNRYTANHLKRVLQARMDQIAVQDCSL